MPVALNLSVVKAVDSDPVLDSEERVGLEAAMDWDLDLAANTVRTVAKEVVLVVRLDLTVDSAVRHNLEDKDRVDNMEDKDSMEDKDNMEDSMVEDLVVVNTEEVLEEEKEAATVDMKESEPK